MNLSKVSFIIGIIVLILSGCSENKTTFRETDLESENLFGNVEWVKTMKYSVINKFGELTKGDRYILGVNQLVFDKSGNKTESIWYNNDGDIDTQTIYKYNEEGILLGSTTFNSDGSLKRTSTFEINIDKKEEIWNFYESDGKLDETYIYTYNNINRIQNRRYNSEGELDYKITFDYNSTGNLSRSESYDSQLNLENITSFEYDDYGNNVERVSYKPDGSLDYRDTYKYEYDDNNNWVKRIEYTNYNPNRIVEREIKYF